MGFFSSIVSFIKTLVADLVNAIAGVFDGGQTGVFLATLAAVVVSFVILGPAAFKVMLETPWLFLEEHMILSALVASALVQAVSLVIPEFGKALGYVYGLLSFILIGANLLAWYTNGATLDALQLWKFIFPAGVGLTEAQITMLYTFTATSLSVGTVVATLSGTGSPLTLGWLEGLFAVPKAVAAAADTALEAVLSATSPLLLFLAAGALLLLNRGGSRISIATGGGPNGT